jgi:hypothetical protein
MGESKYQRLTGRSYGLQGISTLWLGDGYLLQVSSTLVSETYRRWYLVNAQAFIARRSKKRMAWNIVWGILGGGAFGVTAGFLGLAAATGAERETQTVLQVFAALSGIVGVAGALLMLINTALGPTCAVFIQTPHRLDPLGAPTRQRAFDRLLTQLRPQIEFAQHAIRSEPAAAQPAPTAEAATTP